MPRRYAIRSAGIRGANTRQARPRCIFPPYAAGAAAPTVGLPAMSRTATIYGQTITPDLFYVGEGYNGSTTWTAEYGPNLTVSGSGTTPTLVDSPTEAVRPADAAVQLTKTAAKFMVAADTSKGGFGTDDVVIEAWVYPNAAANETLVGKGSYSTGNAAWYLYFGPNVSFQMRDAANNAMSGGFAIGTAGEWQHYIIAIDRSHATGAWVVRNGVAHSYYRNPSAVTGSITGGSYGLMVNGTASIQPTSSARVALLAMWHAPNWLDADNRTPVETWAAARRNLALGV